MMVTLNSGEMAAAHLLATMRRCVNQSLRIADRRFSHDAIDIDMTGAVAEIAWAKAWNIYPDLSCDPRSGTADCVLHGRRVDIKATTKRHHQLITHVDKAIDAADVYVLAIVNGSEVDFVGWAAAAELVCEERIADLGHGPTYVLPQDELRRFKCDNAEAATVLEST